MYKIPVEVSARHCHLNQEDIDKLFGKGYQLKVFKKISQPGQFAAREEVMMKGPKGELSLRIVAPARTMTQVELSMTECHRLGIKPVLRVSGEQQGTPGAVLIGPKGKIKINKGVLVSKRHLHLSPAELKSLKLKDKQKVSIMIRGERGLVFNNVIIRTGKEHKRAFQIDTDEANACGWFPGMKGELLK